MVCGNDCQASAVGSSPQGVMPNSMKEKHIVVIAMLQGEGTGGDKSKVLRNISIRMGLQLDGKRH